MRLRGGEKTIGDVLYAAQQTMNKAREKYTDKYRKNHDFSVVFDEFLKVGSLLTSILFDPLAAIAINNQNNANNITERTDV